MKRACLAVLLAVTAASCRHEAPASRRATFANAPVILISIDTLRADHLPAYGYRGVATPNLDALANESLVFDRAYSHVPMTLPSHVSMLTGLLPTEHGVRNNLGFDFDASKFASLPTLLKARGYATGAAVSSFVLRGETGLRGAFDWYDDAVNAQPNAAFADYQRSGDVTREHAERWIDEHASQPFFLFLHLYEPHVPYDPPEPFRSRYASRYDGEIATADAIVGRFLDHLRTRGLYDKAIVILTSDHGEGLGDHGEQQHSILLYTESIRVPLFVKLPDHRAAHVARPAASIDILPTVAALTGIERPAAAHGVSLLELEQTASRDIYSETEYPYIQLGWSDLRSLVNERFHYIDGPKPELYDVTRDAREQTNVLPDERREASRLARVLADVPRGNVALAKVDPETASKLAALGYIGNAHERPDPRTLPNPRDSIALLDRIHEAFALAAAHHDAEAIAKMRAILAESPRLMDVWTKLAEVYAESGRYADAIAAYKQAIGVAGVFSPDVVAALGNVQLEAGKLDDAAQSARLALAGAPERARALLVRVALAHRDFAEAERVAREGTADAGAKPSAFVLLAEVQKARGDFNGALATLDDAQRRANGVPVYGAELLRGDLLMQFAQPENAMATYEREIAAFPTNRQAYAHLAVVHFVTGNRGAVERTLERMVAADPSPASYALAAKTLETLEDVAGAKRWKARIPR